MSFQLLGPRLLAHAQSANCVSLETRFLGPYPTRLAAADGLVIRWLVMSFSLYSEGALEGIIMGDVEQYTSRVVKTFHV